MYFTKKKVMIEGLTSPHLPQAPMWTGLIFCKKPTQDKNGELACIIVRAKVTIIQYEYDLIKF